MKILHGLTGSIATTLYPKLKKSYIRDELRFIATNSACSIEVLQEPNLIYRDWDAWYVYNKDKKVLHTELVRWADVLLIAPCSANTLAKIANGICDNLLTCVARAWNFEKQFIIAPSMNTHMLTHPCYQKHIETIQSWGVTVIPPQKKELYCGDYGDGAMANLEDIVNSIKQVPKSL